MFIATKYLMGQIQKRGPVKILSLSLIKLKIYFSIRSIKYLINKQCLYVFRKNIACCLLHFGNWCWFGTSGAGEVNPEGEVWVALSFLRPGERRTHTVF